MVLHYPCMTDISRFPSVRQWYERVVKYRVVVSTNFVDIFAAFNTDTARVTRYLNDLVELVRMSHTPDVPVSIKDRTEHAIVSFATTDLPPLA